MLQSIHYHLPNTFLPSPPPHHHLHRHRHRHRDHHHHHRLLQPNSHIFVNNPTSSLNTPLFNTQIAAVSDDGPVELLPETPSIFATNDDPTPLQISTSVLLTGAISVFLFRSVRRRIKRSKELRMRSTGAKSLKDEALDSLKAMGSISVEPKKKDPSPVQAFLGGISAGVIALILYKFTLTIEAALNRQTLSDAYSVRQITVTIRTIINGLCYLATFIFGFNSLGLFLYSGQLTLNSLFDDSKSANSDAKTTSDKPDAGTPELSSQSPENLENKDTDQTS